MIIQKLTITKKQLNLLPEKEKIFIIQLGHLANELIIATKLLIFARTEADVDILRKAYATQASFITRICIGKVFEGWRLLEENFFASKLAKKYEAKLPRSSSEALQNLKKYFSKKNLISEIRNKFSFHNPSFQDISEQLALMPDDAELYLFLGTQNVNSNYYLSEEIISIAMLSCVESDTLQQAIEKMYKEFSQVGEWFVEFCGGCMVAISEENWGARKHELKMEEIYVQSQGNVRQFTIPFFVER